MSFIGNMDRGVVSPQNVGGTAIRPIPCAGARVVVTIDGRPYAGFSDRATAEEAVKLWSGEPIDEEAPFDPRRAALGWAALRGRTIDIVER